MAKTDVQCRFCKKPDFVYKHGIGSGGHPRFRCTDCKKTFQLDYTYTAHKEGIKEQVVTMAMNGSGVRDTSRVLGIGLNTQHFKKLKPKQITHIPFNNIQLICEVDEQWSFVGKKSNQRWLWYAWEPRFKRVIAYVFGRRTSATLLKLLVLLKPFKVRFFCTDNFSPYESYLPESKHITEKAYTQRIKRQNLTLRTRLKRLMRKTICFSKSEEMHDKVIGTFIERYYFNALES